MAGVDDTDESSAADAQAERLFTLPTGQRLPENFDVPRFSLRQRLVQTLHDETRCPLYTRTELAALLDRLVDWRDRNRDILVDGAVAPFGDSPWLASAFSSIHLHPRLVSLRAIGLLDGDVARVERERLFDLTNAVCNLCTQALSTSAPGVMGRVLGVLAESFTRTEVDAHLALTKNRVGPTMALRFGDSARGIPVVDLSKGVAAALALAIHVEDEITEGPFHAVRSMWSSSSLLANKTIPSTYLEYVGTKLQPPLDAFLDEVDRRFCIRERTLAEPDPVADHHGARWAAAEARLSGQLANTLLDEVIVRVRVAPAHRTTVELAVQKSADAIVAALVPKPSLLPEAPPTFRRATSKWWDVTFRGVPARVRHFDGADCVAMLLLRPGTPKDARELRTAKDGHDDEASTTPSFDLTRTRPAIAKEVGDLRTRRKQLMVSLKSASTTARPKLKADIKHIEHEIMAVKKRAGGSDKAYANVHKAIERFKVTAEEDHPDFGRHLRDSITFKDGKFVYRPKEEIHWFVKMGPPPDPRRQTTKRRR